MPNQDARSGFSNRQRQKPRKIRLQTSGEASYKLRLLLSLKTKLHIRERAGSFALQRQRSQWQEIPVRRLQGVRWRKESRKRGWLSGWSDAVPGLLHMRCGPKKRKCPAPCPLLASAPSARTCMPETSGNRRRNSARPQMPRHWPASQHQARRLRQSTTSGTRM